MSQPNLLEVISQLGNRDELRQDNRLAQYWGPFLLLGPWFCLTPKHLPGFLSLGIHSIFTGAPIFL